MEEVFFPEWDQLASSYAVINPLRSYNVKLGLLDDPFDVDGCRYSVRRMFGSARKGLTGGSPIIYHEQRFLIRC